MSLFFEFFDIVKKNHNFIFWAAILSSVFFLNLFNFSIDVRCILGLWNGFFIDYCFVSNLQNFKILLLGHSPENFWVLHKRQPATQFIQNFNEKMAKPQLSVTKTSIGFAFLRIFLFELTKQFLASCPEQFFSIIGENQRQLNQRNNSYGQNPFFFQLTTEFCCIDLILRYLIRLLILIRWHIADFLSRFFEILIRL